MFRERSRKIRMDRFHCFSGLRFECLVGFGFECLVGFGLGISFGVAYSVTGVTCMPFVDTWKETHEN